MVSKQRQAYKKNKLAQDKIRRLDDLGFIWDILTYQRDQKIDNLIDFESKNGHCNVPQNYPENPALVIWCQNTRQAYKKNKLAQDKINQLDDLGFS